MTKLKSATFALFCLAAAVSCSTPKGDSVSTKKYTLNHIKRVTAADPAIRFEQRSRLFGAVSTADMEALDGIYYTTHWSLEDDSQPATLRLEYRQARTGSTIFKKETQVSGKKGVHEFSVIGAEFQNNHVTSWKVSLVRGSQELAAFKSYIWE